jgi:hypothetical protein
MWHSAQSMDERVCYSLGTSLPSKPSTSSKGTGSRTCGQFATPTPVSELSRLEDIMADKTDATTTSLMLIEDQAETHIRRTQHDGRWYFSIIDVIGVLTDSPTPKRYWAELTSVSSVMRGLPKCSL